MLIDLQLHSIYSDGYLTPTEVAKFAAENGVKVAALTDHNTVGGVHEFRKACKELGVKPITGLELYVKLGNKKMNILWYNFDETCQELHTVLRDSQRRRRRLFRATLERLKNRGFRLDVDRILDKYNHYVPLNHVVDDIIANKRNLAKIKQELGIKKVNENDVISKYLQHKQAGKLQNSYLSLERIFALRKKIGGQIVLCHPAKSSYIRTGIWEKLKKMGLDGVEALSPHHSYGAVVYIQYLARELNLIETGGSDFHRFEGGNHLIQNSWEYFKIDSEELKGVEKIIG